VPSSLPGPLARSLLDSAEELGDGVEARPITTREGYDRWAPFYDEPGNQLLDIEQPIVREILDSLPVGVALDAACVPAATRALSELRLAEALADRSQACRRNFQ
jgi:hypothetical protein